MAEQGEGLIPMIMITRRYVRLSDDLLEHLAVFVDEKGEVTLSLAFFNALMKESGWKQKDRGGQTTNG